MSPIPAPAAIARYRRPSRIGAFVAATAATTMKSAVDRKTSEAHQKSTFPAACIHGK